MDPPVFTLFSRLSRRSQNAAALEGYERAATEAQGYFGNPLATLDEVLAEDPDFAMAHALRADRAVALYGDIAIE